MKYLKIMEEHTKDLPDGKHIIKIGNMKKVITVNKSPSMTDQSFADDCDINTIVQRFLKTGEVTHLNNFQGKYADVSEIKDLAESMVQVQYAKEAFMSLPSRIRNRFNNDPVELIDFLADSKNKDEAIQLGLIESPEEIIPIKDKPKKDPEPKTEPTATPSES